MQANNANELVTELTKRTLDLLDGGVTTPIILIDGRSCTGKTTLAADLQNELFRAGESAPRVVHMDDLYDGWTGLQAGVEYLQRQILTPVLNRRMANWQEYNWELGERGRWREFSGGTPLIVEGCGALSAWAAEHSELRVWLEAADEERANRWQARVGSKHDEHWPVWAAQELDFYAREKSAQLANFTLKT